jgi:hypothetical protein
MIGRLFGKDNRSATSECDPYDILRGLRPGLVIDLAHLAGSSVDDLRVTFQVMDWGDRATLAAYGVIELGDDASNPNRELRVNDSAVELVEAAAEVVANAVEPAAVTRLLEATDAPEATSDADFDPVAPWEDALPLVEVSTYEQQQASEGQVVYGVVEAVKELADLKAVTVAVVASDTSSFAVANARFGRAVEVLVATPKEFFVETDYSVTFELSPETHQPRTIASAPATYHG